MSPENLRIDCYLLWWWNPEAATVFDGGASASSSLRYVTKTSDVGLWSEIRLVCRKTSTKVVALLLLLLCRSLSLSNFSDDEALRRGSRLGCVVCSGSFKLDIMDRPRVALVGRETHRKCGRKTCKTKRIQHLFHRQASTVAFAGGNWSRTALGRRWL